MLFGYTSFILNGCASLSALLTRRGAEETHRIITFPMALLLDACLGGAQQRTEISIRWLCVADDFGAFVAAVHQHRCLFKRTTSTLRMNK